MSSWRRLGGALVAVVAWYLAMVLAMWLVASMTDMRTALRIAEWAFPMVLAAIAAGWYWAAPLTEPFFHLARRLRK